MLQVNIFHIVCVAFIFFVQKRHCHLISKSVSSKKEPPVVDTFSHLVQLPTSYTLPSLSKYVASIVALFLMFNHEKTASYMHSILEWMCVMLIHVYALKAFMQFANPTMSQNINEYLLPLTFALCLLISYYNVIHPRYHMVFCVTLLLGQWTCMVNDKTRQLPITTTSCVQHLILVLCMFLVYKQHLIKI